MEPAGPAARQSGMLDPAARAFLAALRVGHLATADAGGDPHVVPVCYALERDAFAHAHASRSSSLFGRVIQTSGDSTSGHHVPPEAAASIYITIDAKPKRRDGGPIKRLANIAANPRAALVVDRYDEDWRKLGWVMLRGPAEILAAGAEHDAAQALLRTRYPQLAAMAVAGLPVIALRVARVTRWGAV